MFRFKYVGFVQHLQHFDHHEIMREKEKQLDCHASH